MLALLSYVLLLSYFAATMTATGFHTLFSETGFFESFSILFWIVAAIAIVLKAKPLRGLHVAAAVLFLLCAMREADWHKKFTTDGIFKLKYYTKSLAPLAEKIPAAMVVLLFIGLVVYALVCGYRYVRSKDKCCSDSLILMILGGALFFLGKILDRSASILEKSFEIVISPNTKRFIYAYEEGLEMITPLMFVIAFVWRESPSEELA